MIYAAIILILIYLLVLIIVGHKEEGIGWIVGGMFFCPCNSNHINNINIGGKYERPKQNRYIFSKTW